MGCCSNLPFSKRFQYFTISFLIVCISSSSHLSFNAGGRKLIVTTVHPQSQIGSRPPRCDRRCSSCGLCKAIQVPSNSQITRGDDNCDLCL